MSRSGTAAEKIATLDAGGFEAVAAYLMNVDLADFNPKAPPKQTAAFWSIVDANRPNEEAELQDILDALGNPDAVTLANIIAGAREGEQAFHALDDTNGRMSATAYLALSNWLQDRRNSQQIPHRMESVGYIAVRNPSAQDGKWKIGGRRQVVYAKKQLPDRERLSASAALARDARDAATTSASASSNGHTDSSPEELGEIDAQSSVPSEFWPRTRFRGRPSDAPEESM